MKTIPNLFFLCFCSFLLITCNSGETDDVKEDNSNKAVSTFKGSDADKEKWGDFQLVLEMKKSSYTLEEKIEFELYFSNLGDKTISFPGIFPVTQMESPPVVNIWSADLKFAVDKLEETWLNENAITVVPKSNIVLSCFDLKETEGMIWQKVNSWEQESGNIGEALAKGIYYASASFIPKLQIYGCMTDTLSFEIK